MKSVILITSCSYHLARNEQCRRTWLKTWSNQIDYRFVFGAGRTAPAADELTVQVDDSYMGLPAKIQASHKWALEQGYDYILKTDCDVYLHIGRLLMSGFQNHSYSGYFMYPEFAMGACYWLDKKASEILVNAPLPYPGTPGGDDMWVGRVMAENSIQGHSDSRYHVGPNPNWNEVISVHLTDIPESMAEVHEKFNVATI